MLYVIIILLLIIIIIITLLTSFTIYQAQKEPPNSPSKFLANKGSFLHKKVVVCIGDSLTHGRVSYNYIDMLTEKLNPEGYEFVNAGINGELAYNVLKRIDEVIKCKPDYIVYV